MCNYHLRDKNLSLKAIGLLSIFLSLPEDWKFSVRGTAAIIKDGKASVERAMKELKEAGYLETRQLRDGKGKLGQMMYIIYEMPREMQKSDDYKAVDYYVAEEGADIEPSKVENPYPKIRDTDGRGTENPHPENRDTDDRGMENPHPENRDTDNRVTEKPCTENRDADNWDTEKPCTENRDTENRDTENPYPDNRAQINTNRTNKEKLTARVVSGLALNYLRQRSNAKQAKNARGPVGKQTVKQLLGQNKGVTSIDIADTDLKDFQRVAGKYGIDYAIRKDSSKVPPRYIVFFKAQDADAMTAAFREYSFRVANRQNSKPSVLEQLHKAVEIAASMPQRAVEHVKNLHQDLSL